MFGVLVVAPATRVCTLVPVFLIFAQEYTDVNVLCVDLENSGYFGAGGLGVRGLVPAFRSSEVHLSS
ncbi:MAG: hypothetical protein NT069_06565, partial [Planctomycetota bacterium]|nr:hypothetical protein [Planctomycetota bacterium]